MIDETHDPARRSWVNSANGHSEFPLQNLPLGVFSPPGGGPRGGVAIGDGILDIEAALDVGLFTGAAREAAKLASARALNAFLEAGPAARRALRCRLSELLDAGIQGARPKLWDAAGCTMHLPAQVGNFSDFYAGIHHSRAGGMINRPDNPLMPNYKYVPVAYHSRASTMRVSGSPLRRPNGQRKLPDQAAPDFGPCRNLDYEMELGIWIGPGNEIGSPIPVGEAARHVAGYCLLNDWSARDIQSWESAPLGPFLGKSFSTFVSPWIITPEALAPFRIAQPSRPDGDPAPLPHLLDAADQASGAFDIDFDVFIRTPAMRQSGLTPHRLSRSNASMLYWTVAQMVAHHTSNGCNLLPGDVFGSGTVSGPVPGTAGCLLEATYGGRDMLTLSNGERRRYLQDGDDIIFQAHCGRTGYNGIGFGECRGRVGAA
jgi:fumarylacetoacetase